MVVRRSARMSCARRSAPPSATRTATSGTAMPSGSVAGAEAGVPADDPTVTEQTWLDAARPHFKGRIIVARDLMEI